MKRPAATVAEAAPALPAANDGAREVDHAEFAALYESTFPQVYAYLYRRCGGIHAVAEELTQETYLGAVRAMGSGEGAAVSPPWLFGVARHKIIDHYRRQEREIRRLSVVASDPTAAPRQHAGGEEARAQTMAALAGMPAMQRAALVLRYLDDMPVPEVASSLGKSVHAAESLLVRARQTFLRRYREADDD